MGFPSPAADYVESRLSLDEVLIQKPAATYYMRAGETIYRCGIMKDALLVIDSSLSRVTARCLSVTATESSK